MSTTRGKSSIAVNHGKNYEHRLQRLKLLREQKNLQRESDPLHSRIGTIFRHHSHNDDLEKHVGKARTIASSRGNGYSNRSSLSLSVDDGDNKSIGSAQVAIPGYANNMNKSNNSSPKNNTYIDKDSRRVQGKTAGGKGRTGRLGYVPPTSQSQPYLNKEIENSVWMTHYNDEYDNTGIFNDTSNGHRYGVVDYSQHDMALPPPHLAHSISIGGKQGVFTHEPQSPDRSIGSLEPTSSKQRKGDRRRSSVQHSKRIHDLSIQLADAAQGLTAEGCFVDRDRGHQNASIPVSTSTLYRHTASSKLNNKSIYAPNTNQVVQLDEQERIAARKMAIKSVKDPWVPVGTYGKPGYAPSAADKEYGTAYTVPMQDFNKRYLDSNEEETFAVLAPKSILKGRGVHAPGGTSRSIDHIFDDSDEIYLSGMSMNDDTSNVDIHVADDNNSKNDFSDADAGEVSLFQLNMSSAFKAARPLKNLEDPAISHISSNSSKKKDLLGKQPSAAAVSGGGWLQGAVHKLNHLNLPLEEREKIALSKKIKQRRSVNLGGDGGAVYDHDRQADGQAERIDPYRTTAVATHGSDDDHHSGGDDDDDDDGHGTVASSVAQYQSSESDNSRKHEEVDDGIEEISSPAQQRHSRTDENDEHHTVQHALLVADDDGYAHPTKGAGDIDWSGAPMGENTLETSTIQVENEGYAGEVLTSPIQTAGTSAFVYENATTSTNDDDDKDLKDGVASSGGTSYSAIIDNFDDNDKKSIVSTPPSADSRKEKKQQQKKKKKNTSSLLMMQMDSIGTEDKEDASVVSALTNDEGASTVSSSNNNNNNTGGSGNQGSGKWQHSKKSKKKKSKKGK